MNRKQLIFLFILLGFVIGVVFGSFELVKFTGFQEKDIERNKIKFNELSSFEKILLGIYFLAINTFGFTIIMLLPVIPVCLFWSLYRKEQNNSEKLWPAMMICWGLYSEIIFINWGLPFLDKIRHYMSHREIFFNNLLLFCTILILSLLSFHLAFRIYNAISKGYWVLILINFIFLVGLTVTLRFFFIKYFEEYVPATFRSTGLFLSLILLFLGLSIIPLYYERVVSLFGKNSPGGTKLNSKFLFISKLGMISLFALIFLTVLACSGYYKENLETGSEVYSEKDSPGTILKKGDINVILILIDTLRSDRLSCYGYKQETSPNIDELAKEGVLFTNSFSQTSWTKSSVACLFTSLYPAQHNANIFEDTLPDKANTIAEILKGAGYITAAFVANPNVGKAFNFNQGFDLYCDDFIKDKIYYSVLRNSFLGEITKSISRNRFFPQDGANADTLNALILPWLKNHKDNKFFLYLHYRDPHSPYSPPFFYYRKYVNRLMPDVYKGNDRFDVNVTEASLYDGEIEFTDFQIGELLKEVDNLKLEKNTLVILLSDHGEAFLEHENKEHGFTLYQEEIRVPLIMRLPGVITAGESADYQVCTIDVMPTIIDILNIRYKGMTEGKSLVPVIKNPKSSGERDFIFFEERYLMGKPILLSLREGEYKYIFTKVFKDNIVVKSKIDQLFDLQKDPEELRNIANQRSEIVKRMKEKMDLLIKHMKETSLPSVKTRVDEKTKEQIRALGYIQ